MVILRGAGEKIKKLDTSGELLETGLVLTLDNSPFLARGQNESTSSPTFLRRILLRTIDSASWPGVPFLSEVFCCCPYLSHFSQGRSILCQLTTPSPPRNSAFFCSMLICTLLHNSTPFTSVLHAFRRHPVIPEHLASQYYGR